MADTPVPASRQLLRLLPRMLNRRVAKNLTATFAFRLHGEEGGEYTLRIEQGECFFEEGVCDSPSVTLEAPAQVWLDLAAGVLGSWQAVRAGLKVRGNRFLMLRFNRLFSGDPDGTNIPVGLYGETENERQHRRGIWLQPRRVLAIQASPRGRGGATEKVFAPLIAGIESAGTAVDTLYLAERDIRPCAGCFACWKVTDGRCVIEDDMAGVLGGMPTYDLVVMALPLYVDGVPGILKNFLDRLIPLVHPYIFSRNGRCRHPARHPRMPNLALVSVCGYYETENFDPLLTYFEAVARNNHTPLVAALLRPHAMLMTEDVPVGPIVRVERALHAAGMELVKKGKVSRKLRKAVSQPLTSRGRVRAGVKKWWQDEEE
jgi:putative sterol carrier protein